MDRDQRRYIHQIVKKLTTVISETKDIGNRKFIVFSKEYTNKFGKTFYSRLLKHICILLKLQIGTSNLICFN
jgi:hypothetical protein